MSDRKASTFFKGISVQAIVTVVMGLLEMVLFSVFSRLLSKEDFGYFAALIGVVAICQSISEAGLGASIIQKKDASKKFVSTAFTLSFGMGLICAIILFLLAPKIAILVSDETLTVPLRIMSVSLVLNSLISVGNAQLYRELKFKRVGLLRCISYILAGTIGVFLALKGFGLYAIVTYTVCDSLILVILLYLTSVKVPKCCIGKEESKGIISFGGWLTLGVILNNITRQMDKIFTSRLISVEALGSYNRPAGFVSSLTSKITGMFDTVLFPMLSDLQNQRERVISVFYRSISLLNSISAVLSAIFFFNAELIITIFFGEEWLELAPIMKIVSISVLFNVDGQLVDCFFRSMNFVKTGFFVRLLGAIITLLCIFIGAKRGITGLAIGLVISNVSLILIKIIILTFKLEASLKTVIHSWLLAWKPVVILILIGCISFFFEPSIIKHIILAVVFAFVIIMEFGFFPKMVSEAYEDIVYPQVQSIKNRFRR